MAPDELATSQPMDGPEITDLRPPRTPARAAPGVRLLRGVWARGRLALGLLLVLLLALLVHALLADGRALRVLIPAAPTLVTDGPEPTETVSAAPPPAPLPPLAAPTAVPGAAGTPALGPAPASCGAEPPPLTPGGPPLWGEAIGRAPVLLGGFIGPYATMPLGPAASTMAYGWKAPHTQYGWPAPIGLVLRAANPPGPVTLAGWDVRTGHPLWFGFITAGQWGPPARVVPSITLDPAHPAVPAGGWTGEERFWYGYAFLPGAGCYVLSATWPGGAWRATVSAGAVSTPGG
ncbi:MAG TPA: hypothetical protein VID73_11260 [Ktedonobacterales bacterium]